MSTRGGTPLVGRQDAYFVIDTHNIGTGVSSIGCGGYNGSTDGVTNQISFNKSLFINGLRLSGKSYYTGFGISYPEGNYGGDAASCQGISSGYNVRVGGSVYGAGRALTLYAWDNDTDSWVGNSFFRGTGGVGGRCYDNYNGYGSWPEQIRYFGEDFSRISGRYPNATFIVIGSHASSGWDQTAINILISLGAPASVVNSWLPSSDWKEFVLVGRPGLGSGNAYGWAIENYPTNPTQVGHLNFGLEIKNSGELEFDGTDDYITFTGITGHQQAFGTIEAWCHPTNVSGQNYVFSMGETQVFGSSRSLMINDGVWYVINYGSSTEDWLTGVSAPVNTWMHVAYTWYGTTCRFYLNGTEYTATRSGLITPQGTQCTIGSPTWSWGIGNSSYNFNGKIGSVKAYSKGLTQSEIQNNYNRTKSQYGL
jgi:hypothetical protein